MPSIPIPIHPLAFNGKSAVDTESDWMLLPFLAADALDANSK
jgi:hypothetical protein